MRTALPLLLALFPAFAASAQSFPTGKTIRVSATGETKANPDQGELDFAVETSAPTAKGATEENAKRMERVIAALVSEKVPRKDIETRDFTVSTDYAYTDGKPPKVKGYRASNRVVFKSKELAKLGTFIDKAVAAGVNQVNGVTFSLSAPQEVEHRALQQAMARARKQAEIIAAAGNVQLGKMVRAETGVAPIRPITLMRMAMKSAQESSDASTQLQPGEQTVTSTATVEYEFN